MGQFSTESSWSVLKSLLPGEHLQWLETEFSLVTIAIASLLLSKLLSLSFLDALLSLLRDFFVLGEGPAGPGGFDCLADFLGRDFPLAVLTCLMLSTDLITSYLLITLLSTRL